MLVFSLILLTVICGNIVPTTSSRSCILHISPAEKRPLSNKLRRMGLRLISISSQDYYEVRSKFNSVVDEGSVYFLNEDEPPWTSRLSKLPGVVEVLPNSEKVVSLRQLPSYTDPEWQNGSMYYWKKDPTTADIGINEVWKLGYTGSGITIAVIDDGTDTDHDDLKKNYQKAHSFDYVRGKQDNVKPAYGFTHGTKVAGVALATRDNGVCGFGAAPDANLAVVRVISSSLTSTPAREAEMYIGRNRHQYVDIFVNSWGVNDNGNTVDGPQTFVLNNQRIAAKKGRKGKGSILVLAAGNGGADGDDCICDGYVSNRFVIAAQAVTSNGSKPLFTEHCSAALTSAIVGDTPGGLVTTVNSNLLGAVDCDTTFSGTSAAAPIVAGLIALALQKNDMLSRRDVTELVIDSSQRLPSQNSGSWVTNGAGRSFNPYFGFGLLNVETLVNKSNHAVANMTGAEEEYTVFTQSLSLPVIEFDIDCKNSTIKKVEWVILKASIKASVRGDVSIMLKSAQNTLITLLSYRPKDKGTLFSDWKFSTPAFWGEDPVGKWSAEIVSKTGVAVTVNNISLELVGQKQPVLPVPQEVKSISGTNTSITVEFKTNNNVDNYRLCYKLNGTTLWRDHPVPKVSGTMKRETIPGLTLGDTYDVALSWGRGAGGALCMSSCGIATKITVKPLSTTPVVVSPSTSSQTATHGYVSSSTSFMAVTFGRATNDASDKSERRALMIGLACACAVLVIACFVVIGLFFFRKNKGNQKKVPQKTKSVSEGATEDSMRQNLPHSSSINQFQRALQSQSPDRNTY